jgi:hypothetical protein
VFANSSYDDQVAELHEEASARLCEHLALPAYSIAPVLALVGVSGPRTLWQQRGMRRGRSQRATVFLGYSAADRPPGDPPRPTGIDYLALIDAQHTQTLAGRVNYACCERKSCAWPAVSRPGGQSAKRAMLMAPTARQ